MSTESSKFLLVFRMPYDSPELSPDEMQSVFLKWKAWIDQMKSSSVYLGGNALKDTGKNVYGPRGSTLIDGPFAEAKEVVCGFSLLSVSTMEQAIGLAKGCPVLEGGGRVEVREIEVIPGM